MRPFSLALLLAIGVTGVAQAQTSPPVSEYVGQSDIKDGTAPGLKVTALNPQTRRFRLVFAKGDDIRGGLADFAAKNHITIANFTAIGALDSAVIGWSDPGKGFRVERLNEEMEVTSFTGNIMPDKDGKPVVHGHIAVALLRNGEVHSGHLLQGRISITMQLFLEDSPPISPAPAD